MFGACVFPGRWPIERTPFGASYGGVTTGSSCRGHAGVSFLIATVGSTFTSPTVVLVNARIFCDDARAVLLTWINS